MAEPDRRERLQQLLSKEYPSSEDIGEAWEITRELCIPEDEIPIRLLDQQIIQSLTNDLHKLRAERRILELQAHILNEKDVIREIKEEKSEPYWCEECQAYVSD